MDSDVQLVQISHALNRIALALETIARKTDPDFKTQAEKDRAAAQRRRP